MADERLLFLGVAWTREASRRGILVLGKAARLACWTLGLEDHRRIERLALRAEEGCEAARVALRKKQRVVSR